MKNLGSQILNHWKTILHWWKTLQPWIIILKHFNWPLLFEGAPCCVRRVHGLFLDIPVNTLQFSVRPFSSVVVIIIIIIINVPNWSLHAAECLTWILFCSRTKLSVMLHLALTNPKSGIVSLYWWWWIWWQLWATVIYYYNMNAILRFM